MAHVADSGCDKVGYTASALDRERKGEPEAKGLERRLVLQSAREDPGADGRLRPGI